jgi:hypothetical protein
LRVGEVLLRRTSKILHSVGLIEQHTDTPRVQLAKLELAKSDAMICGGRK